MTQMMEIASMKDNFEWTTMPMTKEPIGLPSDAELKYAVPFDWGTLQVTEEAHEAYGFVPLTANTVVEVENDKFVGSAVAARTDIYLLSPQEFSDKFLEEQSPEEMNNPLYLSCRRSLHDSGIELNIAMSEDAENAHQRQIGILKEAVEEIGMDLADAVTPDDIPFEDALKHHLPQSDLMSICSLIAASTESSAIEYMRAHNNKNNLRIITKLGAVGIVGAGAVLAVNGAISGDLSAADIPPTMAVAGFYGYLARKTIKEHLSVGNTFESRLQRAASYHADAVADDIYKTYSTEYFDSQAQAMFDES